MAAPEDVRYSRWLRRAIMLVVGAAAAALGALLLTAAPAAAKAVTIPGVGTFEIPEQISVPAIETPHFKTAPGTMEIPPRDIRSNTPVIADIEFGVQPAVARRAPVTGNDIEPGDRSGEDTPSGPSTGAPSGTGADASSETDPGTESGTGTQQGAGTSGAQSQRSSTNAQPGTSSGTEQGAGTFGIEPGTEFGAGTPSGTEQGSRPSAESSTEPGTSSGTESGTGAGTQSNTKPGAGTQSGTDGESGTATRPGTWGQGTLGTEPSTPDLSGALAELLPELEQFLSFEFPGVDLPGGELFTPAPKQSAPASGPRLEFDAYPGTARPGDVIELGTLPGASDFPPFARTNTPVRPARIADGGSDITAMTGAREFRPATTAGIGTLPGVAEFAGLARTALGTVPSADRSPMFSEIGIGATPAPGPGRFSPFAGFDMTGLAHSPADTSVGVATLPRRDAGDAVPGVLAEFRFGSETPTVARFAPALSGASCSDLGDARAAAVPAVARIDAAGTGAAPFPTVAGMDISALPGIAPLADLVATRIGFGAAPWFGGPAISMNTDTRPAIAEYPSAGPADDMPATFGFEQLVPPADSGAHSVAAATLAEQLPRLPFAEALRGTPFAEALSGLPFADALELTVPTEILGYRLPPVADLLGARPMVPTPFAAPRKTSGEIAVEAARGKLGTNYGMGGTGPDTFDCSGLVKWSYAEAGVDTPRTSYDQLAAGTPVSREDLQPGDLVSYYGGDHSALYAGNGMVIHASTYGVGVTESPVDSMPFAGARRY
ncbi:NlpC/P60 family protein [Nocardia aurea]|uniref:C40 family peptidase n=1 Tax=Nocardia aurea TaxID=2144174 RepID=UPI003F4BB171